jgi:uncharacterized membrane protein YgcG
MNVILCIGLVVVVASCVAAAQQMLNGEDAENSLVVPIVIGLAVGIINYFSPMAATWLTVLFVVVMAILFAGLAYEWRKNGATLREMVPFLILSLLFYLVMKTAASTVALGMPEIAELMMVLPKIILVLIVAFFFVDYLFFGINHRDDWDIDEKYIKGSIILIVLAAIAIIATLFVGAFGDEEASYAASETNYHYYNDEVRCDSDPNNNYNFGPNPYVEGKDANYYAEDFAERRDKDPALLSATALTLDAVTGSDYIGQILYEGYNKKLDVLQKTNAATIVLTDEENTKIFNSTNQAIDEMLASATSVELVKEENIRDQLYMNGYTVNGIPQVVIYETDVTSDWCLVYTFRIKTSTVRVAFRIPCGYQWTNPTEVLNITTASDRSGGGGYTPSPQPSPTPTPKKDPTQDPVYQGNADIGGGKNKESDGTGEYQETKPSKESGSNADSGSSSSSGGSSSSGNSSGSEPATDPITPHSDSHDTGGASAGDNNGEFSMD